MAACTFQGSYYDPTPWLEWACPAAQAVPAGCPLAFEIPSGELQASDMSVGISRGSAFPPVDDLTLTDVGSGAVSISGAKDVDSCSCDAEQVTVAYDHYLIASPSFEPGDDVTIDLGSLNTIGFTIGSAAPCPTLDWPSELDADIACDPCSSSGPDDPRTRGCNASGGASIGAAIAMLALVRRRRRG